MNKKCIIPALVILFISFSPLVALGQQSEFTVLSQLPAEQKAVLLERLQRELCPCCGMTLFTCMSQDPGCEHRLPVIQRLLAEVMANTRKASPPLDHQQKKRTSKSAKPTEIQAIRFQTFTSPQGRFEVSIPTDWKYKPIFQDESAISFTAKGREYPEVCIAFFAAGALAMQMGQSWEAFTSRLSAEDFLQRLFIPLLQRAAPDFRVESLVSRGHQVAELTASFTNQGRKVLMKVVCTMDYIEDPTMLVALTYHNFAYIASVAAEPAELATVEPIAAQIISSFRPTERWMGEVVTIIVQGMQHRSGMIAGTMNRINTMEMQQRMAEMGSMTKTGQGWIDALGGTTRLRDPNSPGTEYRVPDKNKYYYLEGGSVYGTDTSGDTRGTGRTPLAPSR